MNACGRACAGRLLPRVWMIGVRDKIRFLREGLFAKYVLALVGLVVFVLAVNGALETWISYRATKTTLTDAMSEKAEATAQADRAIDLRPRAPDQLGDPRQRRHARPAPRRLCPIAQPGAGGQPALAGSSGQRPRTAAAVAHRDPGQQRRRLFPRRALYRDRHPRRQLRAGRFPRLGSPTCRSRCRIPASTPASPSPKSIFASCRISSATPRSARPPSPMWSIRAARCWRLRPRARRSARICRRCRRSPR